MTQAPFAILLFAAGFGTRMKELTQDRPKPLINVAGKPLIDHALELAQGAGCNPIAANLHYMPEMLEAHLHPKGVETITEAPDILETGGGLRNALPLLGPQPVMTLNTDAVWAGPNPISLLAEAWDPEKMDGLLMCLEKPDAIGHTGPGDFINDNKGRITRGPGIVYGGVQVIKTDGLAEIEAQTFSLNLLWDRMLKDRRLFALTYPGQWCDVGHPGGIVLAEEMLEQSDV